MSLKQKTKAIFAMLMTLKDTLKHKEFTIVTKASTTLGIEASNVKNIISPHDDGYILIKWK